MAMQFMHRMKMMNTVCGIALTLLALPLAMTRGHAQMHENGRLSPNFYSETCPIMEKVVQEVVSNATAHDPKVPARLLRMFFHDCFIRGCDASVLLDSVGNNTAEKDAPPNVSLRAFYVVDDAKNKLEEQCPGHVSCADILAQAAAVAVAGAGGPAWPVEKGRRDGILSVANDTRALPAPTMEVSELLSAFAQRGLSVRDTVALSGGHTLGFSHCSSFVSRLHSFNATHNTDPSLSSSLAVSLGQVCHSNHSAAAGVFLDSTPARFDNAYFSGLLSGRGIFHSDQVLWGDAHSDSHTNSNSGTRSLVWRYASDQKAFFRDFADAMVRMGRIGVLSAPNGQIRRHCRFVN